MELDLFDALRLHRVVEFDVDGARYSVEPHGLSEGEGGRPILRGFVVAGPTLGWKDFTDWSNLKITRDVFSPRE